MVLITTHEIREIEAILEDVIVIKDGNIIGHQNVEQIRSEQNVGIVEWMTTMYEESNV